MVKTKKPKEQFCFLNEKPKEVCCPNKHTQRALYQQHRRSSTKWTLKFKTSKIESENWLAKEILVRIARRQGKRAAPTSHARLNKTSHKLIKLHIDAAFRASHLKLFLSFNGVIKGIPVGWSFQRIMNRKWNHSTTTNNDHTPKRSFVLKYYLLLGFLLRVVALTMLQRQTWAMVKL